LYTTRAVIESLDVPERTLRHWSTTFERHLSAGAQPRRGDKGSSHRRYNDADLALLKRVKTLTGSGLRLAEVDAVLRGDRRPTTLGAARRGAGQPARPDPGDLIEQLAAANQQQRELLVGVSDQLTRRIEELAGRLAEIERRLVAVEARPPAPPPPLPPARPPETLRPPEEAAERPRRFGWFHGKPTPPRRSADAFRRNTIRLMARRGWTTDDLAFYASVPVDVVGRLVNTAGEAGQPPEGLARAIARALEVDPASLYDPSA
jgi:DNA-binding transcriptional MerR regulator